MAPKKTVSGFQFSGLNSGIKKNRKKDLGLIYSLVPAKAVGFFTSNQVQAAPVIQGRDVIAGGRLRAVVVNSGNANAITGEKGLRDSYQIAREAARTLGVSEREVLVSSTGTIGQPLPLQKILSALPKIADQLKDYRWGQFAKAICTTDAFPKTCLRQGKIRGKKFTILGLGKGAGMVEPHMATMLAYIMTDIKIALPLMRKAFHRAVEDTFNCISVDGDQSTNDTALLLSSGQSEAKLDSTHSRGYSKFCGLLQEVCEVLALMMVQDGEGATKTVELRIRGAKNTEAARCIAYTVARSPLVKTSFFGEDPNWGRVFAAVGYSGEKLDPAKVDIFYGKVPVVRAGRPTGTAQERRAHRTMKKPKFSVTVDLKQGKGQARVFTSDLTYEYVKINAEYRT